MSSTKGKLPRNVRSVCESRTTSNSIPNKFNFSAVQSGNGMWLLPGEDGSVVRCLVGWKVTRCETCKPPRRKKGGCTTGDVGGKLKRTAKLECRSLFRCMGALLVRPIACKNPDQLKRDEVNFSPRPERRYKMAFKGPSY